MSVTGRPRPAWGLLALVAAALGVALLVDVALAQTSPFGVPRAAPPPASAEGLGGWLLAKQSQFYRELSTALRLAKADGRAVWGLLGLSFLYGVFHAAGPGHGKAVISSYLLANEETWRRGVALSFASAMLQAVVAVVLVGIAAAVFKATSKAMCDAERVIEIVSYGLIALVGLRLIWVKGSTLFETLWPSPRPMSLGAAAGTADGHAHEAHAHEAHAHGWRGHDHHDQHDHDHHHHDHHHHDHDATCAHCGHSHGPDPQDLAGPGGWQRGLSAIAAVGMRPCSGAILVLVFALAQGLFLAGVGAVFLMGLGTFITVAAIATMAVGAKSLARRLSSGSGRGQTALRGLEFGAAVVVFAFGSLLLAGYLAAERGTCF